MLPLADALRSVLDRWFSMNKTAPVRVWTEALLQVLTGPASGLGSIVMSLNRSSQAWDIIAGTVDNSAQNAVDTKLQRTDT